MTDIVSLVSMVEKGIAIHFMCFQDVCKPMPAPNPKSNASTPQCTHVFINVLREALHQSQTKCRESPTVNIRGLVKRPSISSGESLFRMYAAATLAKEGSC